MSKGDWDLVIRTNLDSVFNMTKQVMDGMVDRGWGRVVNVSSVNGSKGAFGQTNYSAAKAGMHGSLRANDDETNTCREFTLGGIGQTSSGYAPNQRQQDSCSSRR